MAMRSYFDLLSEIEELSTNGHGKVNPLDCFEWCDADEGVEGGLPSQCVSDDLLSEALLGDPLLPLLDEDALQPPPPAAHQPETLMQVSLPAGQPAAPGPAPSVPPPARLPSVTSPSPREVRTPSPIPSNPQPLADPSLQSSSTTPRSPVRVLVRTGRMVAPVTLEKSSRYLVRIPGPTPLPSTTPSRQHTLQDEGKQGSTTPAAPTPEVPQIQAPSTPKSVASTPDSSTPTAATDTTSTSTPFRSLRGGAGVGSREGRCSKRKAYELEPQGDPEMERCRLNAINARRNRELKKARMAELEKRVEEGDRERDRLLGENQQLREGMARLQRQVGHLTSVLRNDSRLSTILDKVSPVRLSLGDSTSLQEEEQGEELPGGVCLHLDGNEATLEFCSLCAKKASKRLR